MQRENNQLKIELHKYKTFVEQLSQKSYQKPYVNYPKPIRKRKHYRDLEPEEESNKSDSFITEIRRPPKKKKKILMKTKYMAFLIMNLNHQVKKSRKIVAKFKSNLNGNRQK